MSTSYTSDNVIAFRDSVGVYMRITKAGMIAPQQAREIGEALITMADEIARVHINHAATMDAQEIERGEITGQWRNRAFDVSYDDDGLIVDILKGALSSMEARDLAENVLKAATAYEERNLVKQWITTSLRQYYRVGGRERGWIEKMASGQWIATLTTHKGYTIMLGMFDYATDARLIVESESLGGLAIND